MKDSPIRHTILGEVTDSMRSDLAKIVAGQSHECITGNYSSGQMAVLKDIASLQTKAIRTFGPAGSDAWWVTRDGLQQSTISAVATLKASWFGTAVVADLCCGLGSDLIALSLRGPTRAVDLNPDVLSFASANLCVANAASELTIADVMTARVDQLMGDATLAHIDPDRRVNGRRHTRSEDLVPDWERIQTLLSHCRGAAIKMAPATSLTNEQAQRCHRMWISSGGSVREQTLVVGELLDSKWLQTNSMQAGERSAISVRGGVAYGFSSGTNPIDGHANSRKEIGEFIIDPDSAIRAADLTEAFSNQIGASPIDQLSGFLTSDKPIESYSEMASCSRVLEVVGCDDRKLRRCFRARNAYPEVIKVRGADQDPALLTKRLRPCGEEPLGLWIGRNGKRIFAAITELPSRG